MKTQSWIVEALRYSSKQGSTLRELQRYIDEHFYEELAVDTLNQALKALMAKGQVELVLERYYLAKPKGTTSAFDKLFGE